ncbi:hypothetical protein HYDPIDRAFT_167143 [Hydnomerulius pinastri MD-312]|nr:hypothetical protein HYDPIDRAFT_167143 [Hydnomerulius pinastri MD-312]
MHYKSTHDSWDFSPSLPVPLDIFFDIVIYLPLQSVLTLRRTSKSLYAVTQLRSLWALLFRTHVLEKSLPYPNLGERSLESLSASELADLTRQAVTLRCNWCRPEPVISRQVDFINPTEPGSLIIFLQFLPGRSNRWLISVTMTTQPRKYLLQCWDVTQHQPRCIAELAHMEGPYGGVVINSDPTSTAVIAMQSAQTEIFSIDFEEEDPESAFVTLDAIDGRRELHLLNGSTLITRNLEDGGAICLWDLNNLKQEKLQLLNPSLTQNDRCQAMHLRDDYILVIRVQSVEIYSAIPRPNILPVRGAPIAYPLAQHRFQWRTDTVTISEQLSWSSGPPAPLPINVFIRFGSIYPWPVNILHHYILAPNPMYARDRETTQYNLPYRIEPQAVQTIGSPVRLFGMSAVALGRYGTALWLDNHTQEWLGPSELGQRLAGKLLAPMGGLEQGIPAGQSDSSLASMVFGVREDDAWNRVAMDEESGRIAVGHSNGVITLLDYA